MILTAQAVPTAALLPCIAALPPGWQAGGADISSGKARLRLTRFDNWIILDDV